MESKNETHDITFKDLILLEHQNDNNFDIMEFVTDIIEGGRGKNLDEISVKDFLPDSKEIMIYDNFNVCYEGRECEIESIQLYEYQNYYIKFHYDDGGHEIDMFKIEHAFDNYQNFMEIAFTVYEKKYFNVNKFLKPITKINCVMKFFKNIYPVNGEDLFLNYMKYYFNSN